MSKKVSSSFIQDEAGNTYYALGAKPGQPSDLWVTAYPAPSLYTRITTATTTIINATGTSGFFRLYVQGGTMGLVTVYDNGAASGTTLYAETPAAKDRPFPEFTRFETGLTIVTAAASILFVEVIPD